MIVDFFSSYGSYHHNVVNKWIHIICVPLILYSFNGMGEFILVSVGDFEVNPILAVNCLACLYYLSLHLFAGLVTSATMFCAHFYITQGYIASHDDALVMIVGVNILGWVAQFVGHGVFEGRKPALFDNLLQGTLSQYSRSRSNVFIFSFFCSNVCGDGSFIHDWIRSVASHRL